MVIDGNQKEKDAMHQFHIGNEKEGHLLQDSFVEEFRQAYANKDHCSCTVACKYHGKCRECVAIHRAHLEHVPNCLRPMLNQRIQLLSELTEHTMIENIKTGG